MFEAEMDYSYYELSPYLSYNAVWIHYTRHHTAYAEKLNELITGTDMENMPLEEIIKLTRGKNEAIFNNAAQLFNHNFYWKSMAAWEKLPDGPLKDQILKQFKSLDAFYKEYAEFAGKLFGSGWSWLVVNKSTKELGFLNTSNAENPIGNDDIYPIFVIDLWEHAYYTDYIHKRKLYIDYMIQRCLNWKFCNELYSQYA